MCRQLSTAVYSRTFATQLIDMRILFLFFLKKGENRREDLDLVRMRVEHREPFQNRIHDTLETAVRLLIVILDILDSWLYCSILQVGNA
jgi:hypothetical protein